MNLRNDLHTYFIYPYFKDNCKDLPNTDQADVNKNGIGDACEVDLDGDRYTNDQVFFFSFKLPQRNI